MDGGAQVAAGQSLLSFFILNFAREGAVVTKANTFFTFTYANKEFCAQSESNSIFAACAFEILHLYFFPLFRTFLISILKSFYPPFFLAVLPIHLHNILLHTYIFLPLFVSLS